MLLIIIFNLALLITFNVTLYDPIKYKVKYN